MSRIERGLANPSLDAIEVLAVALRVEAQDLFEASRTTMPTPTAKPKPILVPFASDGSCFNPSLRRPKSGVFTVGGEGKEVTFDTFNAALKHLTIMEPAYWRRPNKANNWGRVVAVRWAELPKKYLTTLRN